MKNEVICLRDELIRILNNNNNKISFKKKIKNFLKNNKIDIAFWPNSLIIYAFSLVNEELTNNLIIDQFNLWKKEKFEIKKYDDILMSYVFLKNDNLFDELDIRKMIEETNNSISLYKNLPIPYRPNESNNIFIDILGMVPQYLCLYGVKYKNEDYIDWAINQYEEFIKNGFDEKTCLPYHSYDLETKEKRGIIGWGRGLGWILFGLSECIMILYNLSNNKYQVLLNYYLKIIDSSLEYLRKDNGFSWNLLCLDGHLDTSATSLILLSMLTLKKIEVLNIYDNEINNIYKCLCNNIDNGEVKNCSFECMGLGMYPQVYGSYAWSIAPTLCCILLYES